MTQTFDWRLVRSFLAVLDAGSLMGAARTLKAQQPTLGRHIAELEAQLGTPLFERTGRGLTPTAAALSIADAARAMQEGAERLGRQVSVKCEVATGTVRISASEVTAAYLLPGLLTRLLQEEPGIQIELVASNEISNLLRREADIAIRMARPEQKSLVARKLTDVPIVAAAHESYLKRAGTPRKPQDLSRHTLIGYDRDDAIRKGFAARGNSLPNDVFRIRTDDHLTHGRLLAAGAGIGFVASYNLRFWPGVRAVLPSLKIPSMPCWLVAHREVRGSALVRRVYDFLAETIPAEAAAR